MSQIKILQPIKVGLLSEVARATLNSMMKGPTLCYRRAVASNISYSSNHPLQPWWELCFPLYSQEQWIKLNRSTPRRPPSRKVLRNRKSTPKSLSKLGLCWRSKGIGWAPHTLNAYHSQCLAILSFTTQQLLLTSTTRRTDLYRI